MDFDTCIDRSGHNTAKYTQRQAVFGRKDILPMWVADMDFIAPQCIQKAIEQRAKHPVFGYVDKPTQAIKAQIAWIERRQNYKVNPDWVMSCHSIVTSIHIAIQAFSHVGDDIIIMNPVYHEFANSVEQEGRQLIKWSLHKNKGRYDFSLDELKQQLTSKTKALILCSPHNPIARVWSAKELQAIGEFCVDHNIVIIADEMHSDLVYAPHTFTAMASISPDIASQCVTLQGPGKTFNLTGLGLSSAIISHPKLREQFKKAYQKCHPSYGTSFSQVVFEAGYLYGEPWLNALLAYLDKNQQALCKVLNKPESKITMRPCEATFLAWLDCSGLGMTDEELKQFFIHKAKLGLSPGPQFGEGGTQHMRLNFAVPHKVMLQAIEQLESALLQHM